MPFILNCTVSSVSIVIIKNLIFILFSRLKNEAPTKEQKPVSEVNFVLYLKDLYIRKYCWCGFLEKKF